jgi:hypothetical protein
LSKTKNLNTVVETKMSGVEIFKMFESDLSDICIFKAFGVILLHFVPPMGWSGYRNHTYFFIWPYRHACLSLDFDMCVQIKTGVKFILSMNIIGKVMFDQGS